MVSPGLSEAQDAPAWQRWLDMPQSGLVCVSSWVLSSAIFIGMVALFGGPTQNDAVESLYATWALAHGKVACAYPPVSPVPASKYFLFYQPHPAPPPLWPLISGGIAAVTRIGHTATFPSQNALGASCADGYYGMYKWAQDTAAIFPTIGLGYWSWFVLLAGVVALLRASGRGRTGWEVFGVISVALLPLVWMPLLDQFHPQDLVALGLRSAALHVPAGVSGYGRAYSSDWPSPRSSSRSSSLLRWLWLLRGSKDGNCWCRRPRL